MKAKIYALLIFTAFAYSTYGFDTYFENAIHDPSTIMLDGGTYWTFGTGEGIASKRSNDLVSWEIGESVFPKGTWPAWINDYVTNFSGHFWAPDIIEMNGKYYMYYTAFANTDANPHGFESAIGVAVSNSLNNPDWQDLGMVVSSQTEPNSVPGNLPVNCIDAGVYRDETGNVWMVYGSHFAGIYTVQIDTLSGMPANDLRFPVVGNNGLWNEFEAAQVTYINGYYYMFVNLGECCAGNQSTYYIVTGRSLSPAGPYLDKDNNSLWNYGGTTVLETEGKYIGPGHYGYYDNNGQDLVSIHYYDGSTSTGWPSRLELLELEFTEDDWPVLNRDISINGSYIPVPVEANLVDGGLYRIQIEHSGKYLALDKSQTADCANPVNGRNIYQSSDEDLCSEWILRKNDDYYWTIHPAADPELAAEIFAFLPDNGTNLNLWDSHGGENQQFRLLDRQNGSYQLVARHSSKVLEVFAASTEERANVGQWENLFLDNQSFRFINLDSVNQKPYASIIEPQPASTYYPGTSIDIIANAGDIDGSVERVDFYASGQLVGTMESAPYQISWEVSSGHAEIVAVVTDDREASTTSSPVTVTGGRISGELVTYFENEIHDPSTIMEDDGVFWTFGTGDGVATKYSYDLLTWYIGDPVFALGTWPSWINDEVPGFAGTFWAPGAIEMNGYYYVYYSCSTFGSSRSAIGVARTPSLNNPTWEDLGLVVDSNGGTTDINAIDAGMFKDDDGTVYLTYGSFFGGIGLLEIDPNTGKSVSSSLLPIYGGGHQDIEAPYIIKEGGYYYLIVNRGKCCQGNASTYTLEVSRALNINGPYLEARQLLGMEGEYIGPGHFSLLEYNGQQIVPTHYYDGTTANGWPARLSLLEMTFVDGWPTLTRNFDIPGSYPPLPITAGLQNLDTMRIRASHSNKYISLDRTEPNNGCQADYGTNIIQWSGTNDLCEQWVFRKVDEYYWSILPASNTDFAMDVFGFSQYNGGNVGLWEDLSNSAQQFRFEEADNGDYRIVARHSGKVLDVFGVSQEDGANIVQFAKNPSPGQQFAFEAPQSQNIAPQISIISPTDQAEFIVGEQVVVRADASDQDGQVSKVSFYRNGLLVSVDMEAPYELELELEQGINTVVAIATDNNEANSAPSSIDIIGVKYLHVDSVYATKENVVRGYKRGYAYVVIKDSNGSPYRGVSVTGSFEGTFNETLTVQTGSDGSAVFRTVATNKGQTQFEFCVEALSAEYTYYNSQDDEMTCGAFPENYGASSRLASNKGEVSKAGDEVDPHIQVYPNPTYGEVHITLPLEMEGATIQIYSTSGQLVYSLDRATESNIFIHTESFDKGIYLVNIVLNGKRESHKLIVN